MSKAGHKSSPGQAKQLAEFIKKALTEKGVSQRTAAKEIGIDIAFISRILSGEKTPNAQVCNSIADYFGMPRVQIYALSGWLDLGDVNDFNELNKLKGFFPEQTDQAEIESIYLNIGDRQARTKFFQLLRRFSNETSEV